MLLRVSEAVAAPKKHAIRYGLMVLVIAVTLPIALTLNSFHVPTAFATLLLAVVFSVWRFGIGPGLVASVFTIFSIRFFLLEPLYTIDPFALPDEELRVFLLFSEAILLLWLLGSAQRRAQEKLRASEAYLTDAQALSQTGSVSFIVPDAEVFWSAQAYRVLGYSNDISPSVQRMIARVHPGDIALAQSRFFQLKEPARRIDFEHRIVMPDGTLKQLAVLGKAELERDGKIRVSAAVMDVTEAKLTSASLRKSQAELAHVTRLTAMGELVASISHEINQPLAAIKLSAETGARWLDREPPQLDNVRLSLSRVIDNAARAGALISNLRNMTKKTEVQTRPLDLNHVVADVVQILQREAQDRNIRCMIDLESNLKLVEADEVQLQQILVNFLMNGFDAMTTTPESERQISIRSRNCEDSVAVEVQDAGHGITEGVAGRLFDAFFTTKLHGMGIGLSICRTIAEAHGGKVEAFNNEDRGATFRIVLPQVSALVA